MTEKEQNWALCNKRAASKAHDFATGLYAMGLIDHATIPRMKTYFKDAIQYGREQGYRQGKKGNKP